MLLQNPRQTNLIKFINFLLPQTMQKVQEYLHVPLSFFLFHFPLLFGEKRQQIINLFN